MGSSRALWRFDPEHFASWCADRIPIIDRDGGQVVPFVLNRYQVQVVDAFAGQWNDQGHVRMIVLKHRRAGMSLLITMIQLYMGLRNPAFSGITLAHNDPVAGEILSRLVLGITHFGRERVGLPTANLATGTRGNIRLDPVIYGRGTKRGMGARFRVANGNRARGADALFIHLSEFGFYKHPDKIMQNVANVVDNPSPGSVFIIESTGDTIDTMFHRFCLQAEAGIGPYAFIFLRSLDDPEHAIDPEEDPQYLTEDEIREDRIIWTTKEKDLQKTYSVSDAQLNWIRHKMLVSGNVLESVLNEHPPDLEYAFRTKDGSPFDGDAMKHYSQRTRAVIEGTIPGVLPRRYRLAGAELVEDDGGPLIVYREPRPGISCIIGADTVTGSATSRKGGDNACINVVSRGEFPQQMAMLYGKQIDPELLARYAIALAWWYGDRPDGDEATPALVAGEVPSGRGFVDALKKMGFPEHRIYRDIRNHYRSDEERHIFGWVSTRESKASAYGELARLVRERKIEINDRNAVIEMNNCVLVNGAPKALGIVNHDDAIDSLMICVHINARQRWQVRPPDEDPEPVARPRKFPAAFWRLQEAIDASVEAAKKNAEAKWTAV